MLVRGESPDVGLRERAQGCEPARAAKKQQPLEIPTVGIDGVAAQAPLEPEMCQKSFGPLTRGITGRALRGARRRRAHRRSA
jgi:hypothetical protein